MLMWLFILFTLGAASDGFFYCLTGDTFVRSGKPVSFDKVLLPLEGWNYQSGAFICNRPGRYAVSCQYDFIDFKARNVQLRRSNNTHLSTMTSLPGTTQGCTVVADFGLNDTVSLVPLDIMQFRGVNTDGPVTWLAVWRIV